MKPGAKRMHGLPTPSTTWDEAGLKHTLQKGLREQPPAAPYRQPSSEHAWSFSGSPPTGVGVARAPQRRTHLVGSSGLEMGPFMHVGRCMLYYHGDCMQVGMHYTAHVTSRL